MDDRIRIIDASLRHAFYRGEQVTLTFKVMNFRPVNLTDCHLVIRIGTLWTQRLPLGKTVALADHLTATLDSTVFRSGAYDVELTVEQEDQVLSASRVRLAIAPPRRRDQTVELWHWPATVHYNALEADEASARAQIDLLADMGFTWAQFRVGWSERQVEATARLIEYAMERGLELGILVENTAGGQFRADEETPEEARLVTHDGAVTDMVNAAHPAMRELYQLRVATWLRLWRHYPSCTTIFINSEVEDRLKLPMDADSVRRHEAALGFPLEQVKTIDCAFADSSSEGPYMAPGVIADDDSEYRYRKYYYQHGDNFADTNTLMAQVVHRYRPDMLVISDPLRNCAVYGRLGAVDAVSSWTYTNPDPKMTLFIETLLEEARRTGQDVIHTITLWNYAGTLVPCGNDRFARELTLRMEPDRFKECAWINFGRGPRAIGAYFGSPMEPTLKGGDPFIYSPETETAIADFAREVLQPFGALARRTTTSPRRIAVLDSLASRVYGESPRSFMHYFNYQIYNFYTLLAMVHAPADVLFEEAIEQGELERYDIVVLPCCDTLTETVYHKLCDFAKRGGKVIADQYLRADIPGAIVLDFDFTYRTRVNANANSGDGDFAVKDDTNFRSEWGGKVQVKGVTAQEDQEIMEAYANRLRVLLEPMLSRQADCTSKRVILNLREAEGVSYLFAANDHRTWGERVGKWKSMLEKGLPETATFMIPDTGTEPAVYEMMTHQRVTVYKVGATYQWAFTLPAAGGAIFAIVPKPLTELQLIVPGAVRQGESVTLEVRGAGQGVHALKLTITAPDGSLSDYSGYKLLKSGSMTLPVTPGLNEATGTWKVEAVNLTDGSRATGEFEVREAEMA